MNLTIIIIFIFSFASICLFINNIAKRRIIFGLSETVENQAVLIADLQSTVRRLNTQKSLTDEKIGLSQTKTIRTFDRRGQDTSINNQNTQNRRKSDLEEEKRSDANLVIADNTLIDYQSPISHHFDTSPSSDRSYGGSDNNCSSNDDSSGGSDSGSSSCD